MKIFCVFGKTTPYAKIFEILFRKFSSRHRSTLLCLNFVKFDRREIGEIVRYLPDKKQNFAFLSNCRFATAWIAPKICQGQPPTMHSECPRFHPNRFTFSGVIAERVNTAKSPCKVNSIFGRRIDSSRIITARFVYQNLELFFNILR